MRTYVFYHGNCADGFGAAWAAWKKLGNQVRYIPLHNAEGLPMDLRGGSRVFLLDIGLGRDKLSYLNDVHQEVVMLDHHQTWEDEVQGLDFAHVEVGTAACVLAWRHFHPDRPVPELLRYIEDRDLWNWELPDSRAVNAGLSSYPQEFDVWNGLDIQQLKQEGQPILRHKQQVVERMSQQARRLEVAGYEVPVVNATAYASDLGHYLLDEYPDSPFAAIWWMNRSGQRRWSLRSRGDFDVGRLAEKMGGGGHRAASGFLQTAANRSALPL